MSGPLELYRTTVNLRGLGVGAPIEIDPTDPGWAGDIASKRIVPVMVEGRTNGRSDVETAHERSERGDGPGYVPEPIQWPTEQERLAPDLAEGWYRDAAAGRPWAGADDD